MAWIVWRLIRDRVSEWIKAMGSWPAMFPNRNEEVPFAVPRLEMGWNHRSGGLDATSQPLPPAPLTNGQNPKRIYVLPFCARRPYKVMSHNKSSLMRTLAINHQSEPESRCNRDWEVTKHCHETPAATWFQAWIIDLEKQATPCQSRKPFNGILLTWPLGPSQAKRKNLGAL